MEINFYSPRSKLRKDYTLSKDILILADFNCNMLTKYYLSKQINDICDNMQLTQLIKNPTRITPNSKTLTDLILVSNNLKSLESGTQSFGLSDHSLNILC